MFSFLYNLSLVLATMTGTVDVTGETHTHSLGLKSALVKEIKTPCEGMESMYTIGDMSPKAIEYCLERSI